MPRVFLDKKDERLYEAMQIHPAPGTCCPEMKLDSLGICSGCGHNHRLDAVIAELALRRDWADNWANKESRKAVRMPDDLKNVHRIRSSTYRVVRNHIKARIRYLLSVDKIRRERWLESIADQRVDPRKVVLDVAKMHAKGLISNAEHDRARRTAGVP